MTEPEAVSLAREAESGAGEWWVPARVARDLLAAYDELAASVREREAAAWDAGHSWGWSDAQDAHDVRQSMGRRDWPLCTPNPFKEGAAE